MVTSLTGYEWYERKIDDEGDAIPINAFPAVYEDSAWQVSQELRFEGDGERYRWFLGSFFLYEELEASNLFPGLRSRRIEPPPDPKPASLSPPLSVGTLGSRPTAARWARTG